MSRPEWSSPRRCEEEPEMTVGFGLIGSGMMGRTYAAGIQRQAKDARVVAVAGGSRASKLAAQVGVVGGPAVAALLGRKDVHVGLVTTPHPTHPPPPPQAAHA